MFGVRSIQEPSFEDRLLSARLMSSVAREDYLIAASLLEQEGDALEVLAQEVDAEIDRLSDLSIAAEEDADRNRRIAKNLRDLIEGNDPLTLF